MTVDEAEWVEEYRRGFHLDYTLWNNALYVVEYIQGQRAIRSKEMAYDKGVIFWHGHGAPGGWSTVLDAQENTPSSIGIQSFPDYYSGYQLGCGPIDFGGNCPIVFAWSCETGQYVSKGWDSGTHTVIYTIPFYGMPEAFFRYGAAVYIGSTMTVGGSPTEVIFFSSLKGALDNGFPVGYLFRLMKTLKCYLDENGALKWDTEFAFEFNYYGDPKYGGWRWQP
jgi:hypothetical protein